jgi:hypothetical protein
MRDDTHNNNQSEVKATKDSKQENGRYQKDEMEVEVDEIKHKEVVSTTRRCDYSTDGSTKKDSKRDGTKQNRMAKKRRNADRE